MCHPIGRQLPPFFFQLFSNEGVWIRSDRLFLLPFHINVLLSQLRYFLSSTFLNQFMSVLTRHRICAWSFDFPSYDPRVCNPGKALVIKRFGKSAYFGFKKQTFVWRRHRLSTRDRDKVRARSETFNLQCAAATPLQSNSFTRVNWSWWWILQSKSQLSHPFSNNMTSDVFGWVGMEYQVIKSLCVSCRKHASYHR